MNIREIHQQMVMVLGEIAGRGAGARVTTDMILRIGNLLGAYAESGKAATRFGLSVDVADEVYAMIGDGKIIEAIKRVRAETGMGLREAKDIVDAMREVARAPR